MTKPKKTAAHATALLSVFSLTLFLSAAAMFALEPMIGKMLLPIVGGSTAGWVVAMAFFQVMLLAGYCLAHYLSRFTPRRHALVFIALLALGALFLPVDLQRHAGFIDGAAGAGGTFLLLLRAAGVPFLALAAATVTIQRLFSSTPHPAAADPYFLYAASNLGSFTGLLLYPLLAEPLLGLRLQADLWLFVYTGLMAMTAACIFISSRTGHAVKEKKVVKKNVTTQQRLLWAGLVFFPSSLMLGVTTHISTNVFSAPLIWVAPLALYLLTFVIAFARRPLVPVWLASALHPVSVALGVALLCGLWGPNFDLSWTMAALHLGIFTAVALACHIRLASLRPLEKGSAGLTDFYLMMSVGGALGGLLNAFIAPSLLVRADEYLAVLVLSLVVYKGFSSRPAKADWCAFAAGVAPLAIFAFAVVFPLKAASVTEHARIVGTVALLFALGLSSLNARLQLLAALAVFVLWHGVAYQGNTIALKRGFYGQLQVSHGTPIPIGDKLYGTVKVVNGTILHGAQVAHPAFEKEPTLYYWRGGPAGQVFSAYSPRNVAVVGLGAGALNCYAGKRSAFTFIDIDANAAAVARENFTFLKACPGRVPPEVVIGDGRLELARMKDRRFDLIVLDAFSSDTIPLHLLTREAVETYASRLEKKGILLFHISNRYFNFIPALTRTALEAGLDVRVGLDVGNQKVPAYGTGSVWMVMYDGALVDPAPLAAKGWFAVRLKKPLAPWTDDYTSPLLALRGISKDYASLVPQRP